jgi:spore coat protein U-like protein
MHSFIFFNKFIFAALASAVALWVFGASSSFAAGATSRSSATVIAPIVITHVTDLNFGEFAPGGGGNVTVATDGARTASGPILSFAGSTPAAAKFDVTGNNSATYGITWSGAATLTDSVSSEAMAMSKISDLNAAGVTTGEVTSGELSAGGAQSIYLGGELSVTSGQSSGTYIGDVTVTVEYN